MPKLPTARKPTQAEERFRKSLKRMVLPSSLDTETTGVDLHHGAKPFLVTSCAEDGQQIFWEWDVDPLTREPQIPQEDIRAIQKLIDSAELLVLQNAKFDVAALSAIGIDASRWPWELVFDTLIAGHLLASGMPHNLTDMAVQYLGVDIQPYETKMEEAVKEAQRIVRSQFPDWQLAKKGSEDMPSAKEKTWKFDTWLPRALAKKLGYEEEHPWWTVTSEYANVDSAVTIALKAAQKKEIVEKHLEKIYEERLKVLPIAFNMERRGITMNRERLDQLQEQYQRESAEAKQVCVSIAASYGFDLTLPKNGTNNSLKEMIYEHMKLPVILNPKKKTPSLDKNVLQQYEDTLPPRSRELIFIKQLKASRKRDTSISYMEGYKRYWIPMGIYNSDGEQLWYCIHPSLNPTGTATLRWSSSNPNEQNISKQGMFEGDSMTLRYLFGPAPGREWWSCDAKNIEARLPAYESGEKELIALYERPNEPPYYGSGHLLNFHTVYPDIWEKELKAVGLEKVGPLCKKKYADSWYQYVKNGGFAVQYGAVDKADGTGTADRAFHKPGAHSLLKARFAKLEGLNQACIEFANQHGYVETMPDKTVDPNRGYPLQCTRSEWGRILPTVPLNYHIQGTAMWWMMKAMIRCEAYLQELNADCGFENYWIAMQVHDELVFDFPKGRTIEPWQENLPKIKHIMSLMAEGGNDLGVPTPVSCEYHEQSWSKGISV